MNRRRPLGHGYNGKYGNAYTHTHTHTREIDVLINCKRRKDVIC